MTVALHHPDRPTIVADASPMVDLGYVAVIDHNAPVDVRSARRIEKPVWTVTNRNTDAAATRTLGGAARVSEAQPTYRSKGFPLPLMRSTGWLAPGKLTGRNEAADNTLPVVVGSAVALG